MQLVDTAREACQVLGGRVIQVDRRALFTAQLPSGKCILVKAKLSKCVRDVLRPIAVRYSLPLDLLHIDLSVASILSIPLHLHTLINPPYSFLQDWPIF